MPPRSPVSSVAPASFAAVRSPRVLWLLALALAAFALFIRLAPGPEPRPLHTDEAVNARLLGDLLAGQPYRYDPVDRHGPVLLLTARPLVTLLGIDTHADLQAWHLRLLPALASAALLLLVPLLAPALPAPALGWSLLWLTLAAPLVYYGGYFIHEPLFLLVSLALLIAVRRHLAAPSPPRALLVGLVLGLLLATKATVVLTLAAATLATIALHFTRPKVAQASSLHPPALPLPSPRSCLLPLAAALATACLLFSSFGQNPSGPLDALRALFLATDRATGQGHEKPFLTYAAWYLLPGPRALPWAGWTLAAAFAAGAVLAWRDRAARPLPCWLAVHAAALAILYSLLPYKTPWLALQFLLPAALVAGLAPAAALAALPRAFRPVLAAMAGLALAAALLTETRALVHRFPVDPGNPLAYSPSSPDIEALPARLAAALAGRPAPVVHVYGDDYWPLPWYLRAYPQTGYYSAPPASGSAPAPDAIFLTGDARALDPASLPPPPGAGSWRADFLGLRAELPVIVLLPLGSPPKPPSSPHP